MRAMLENLAALEMIYPVGAAIVWFWVGACIGSFLNVCIWRVPNGMSLISPPSHCPKCGHAIPFYENIPIFSWFFLRGKCSSCHDSISVRYPVVETLTALVFLGIHLLPDHAFWLNVNNWMDLYVPAEILLLTAASVLIASSFTDCDCRIIPDGFVLTLLGAEVLYALLTPAVTGNWGTACLFAIQLLVMAILLSGVALLGKALCHKTALGWGDVKLLTVLTPVVTVYGICWIILLASILLIVCAPGYRRLKPKMRHRAMPFAPFIAIAAAIVLPLLPELLAVAGKMTCR